MSIGASGYSSYDEFAHATYQTYQGAVDDGYAAAQEALKDGTLRVSAGRVAADGAGSADGRVRPRHDEAVGAVRRRR